MFCRTLNGEKASWPERTLGIGFKLNPEIQRLTINIPTHISGVYAGKEILKKEQAQPSLQQQQNIDLLLNHKEAQFPILYTLYGAMGIKGARPDAHIRAVFRDQQAALGLIDVIQNTQGGSIELPGQRMFSNLEYIVPPGSIRKLGEKIIESAHIIEQVLQKATTQLDPGLDLKQLKKALYTNTQTTLSFIKNGSIKQTQLIELFTRYGYNKDSLPQKILETFFFQSNSPVVIPKALTKKELIAIEQSPELKRFYEDIFKTIQGQKFILEKAQPTLNQQKINNTQHTPMTSITPADINAIIHEGKIFTIASDESTTLCVRNGTLFITDAGAPETASITKQLIATGLIQNASLTVTHFHSDHVQLLAQTIDALHALPLHLHIAHDQLGQLCGHIATETNYWAMLFDRNNIQLHITNPAGENSLTKTLPEQFKHFINVQGSSIQSHNETIMIMPDMNLAFGKSLTKDNNALWHLLLGYFAPLIKKEYERKIKKVTLLIDSDTGHMPGLFEVAPTEEVFRDKLKEYLQQAYPNIDWNSIDLTLKYTHTKGFTVTPEIF